MSRLEPDCTTGELGYLRSIAISLKRIADTAAENRSEVRGQMIGATRTVFVKEEAGDAQ